MRKIRLLILVTFGVQGEIKVMYILSIAIKTLGDFLGGYNGTVQE